MGYSRVIVCILIWTVSFHNQQAHALRCYTCYAEGCRDPSQLECPPFTDNNCFVLARSENDNTPDRMGCARNCNAVTGFGNSNLCSLCGTDGCNRDLLQSGRGFGGGSSGVGIGSGASSNNGGWNGQNNNGFNGGGIGNGAGVNSGDPYYGNNGNSGYQGNSNPYSGGQNNNGGIGNGAGVNSGDPYSGSNGNNGNNGYQGNNGIGSGAGVNWNDPNRGGIGSGANSGNFDDYGNRLSIGSEAEISNPNYHSRDSDNKDYMEYFNGGASLNVCFIMIVASLVVAIVNVRNP